MVWEIFLSEYFRSMVQILSGGLLQFENCELKKITVNFYKAGKLADLWQFLQNFKWSFTAVLLVVWDYGI